LQYYEKEKYLYSILKKASLRTISKTLTKKDRPDLWRQSRICKEYLN
jgi:hypothetical protein